MLDSVRIVETLLLGTVWDVNKKREVKNDSRVRGTGRKEMPVAEPG